MKQHSLLVGLVVFCLVLPIAHAEEPSYECTAGDSTEDRVGCLDTDGDGWSDPDDYWNESMGADAFPDNVSEHRDLDDDGLGDVIDPDMDGDGSNDDIDVWPEDASIWSDSDGDGYADQGLHSLSDNCPFIYGKSKIRLKGCSDIDGDFMPDVYDDDADGDGIRNEMERAASSGTILYDPYNADSTPLDTDKDTLPDVLDDDNDNDGWPDDVELDRGSGIYDKQSTPFNMYMGVNSGFFYRGGLGGDSFTTEYDPESFEISLSALSEIVFEELVIPLLLVPIYFAIFFARRSEFKRCLNNIEQSSTVTELVKLEKVINEMVKERKIKVYHGLVLRNALEQKESEFGLEAHHERKHEEE